MMTKTKLVIYGASGHSLVVYDTAQLLGFEVVAFRDDAPQKSELYGCPVVIEPAVDDSTSYVLAIGSNHVRKLLAQRENRSYVPLIHPKSMVCKDVQIGEGTVVFAGAMINAKASIGKHCIVNTGSIIEHEVQLADYVHVSPGAALAGNVSVGEGTHIGINATVIQGVKIGKWCTIGAGAVILRDVPDGCTIVGNPGKIIKETTN